MPRRFDTRSGHDYIVVCLVLFAAANLFHVKSLWGVNSLGYFPHVLSYAALLLVVVSLLPRVSDRILQVDTSFSQTVNGRRLLRAAVPAAIGVVR